MKKDNYQLSSSTNYYSDTDIIEIRKDEDPYDLYEEVEQIARYIYKELDYTFIPYDVKSILDGNTIPFLFTEKDSNSQTEKNCIIFGCCSFSKKYIIKNTITWKLDWVWIHPSYRNKGKLKQHWDYFEKRFGEFLIGKPIEPSMESFLEKCKLDHIPCY